METSSPVTIIAQISHLYRLSGMIFETTVSLRICILCSLVYFCLYPSVSSGQNYQTGMNSVTGLGNTFVDADTAGGPWVLLGYGSDGRLGSLLTTANGTFDSSRQGSATLSALAFAKQSEKLAISWNQTGRPNGGITSYQHAVSFAFPDPSLLTLTAAATPPTGTGSAHWSKVSTHPSTVLLNLETLQGNPNLPSAMYARRETFGANYSNVYGFCKGINNNQLDWGPDGQAFNALYLGINGNGYVAAGGGGTSNGYTPSTMAIWAKMNASPKDFNSTAPLTLAENQPIGTIVGDFNATDSDGDAITYHLVTGTGDGNNTLFTLDQNGTLKTATAFDFESNASSYSIRVQAKDEYNASTEETFTVHLTNVSEVPDFSLSNATLAENLPAGTFVGDFNGSVQVELSVSTSNFNTAESGSAVLVSFFVNGSWTQAETFFSQSNKGQTITKSFTTSSRLSRST